MIGLDTNILIRYLAQDDPVQSVTATEILERRLTPKNPGFVSIVAMVETVWVLDRAYGLTAIARVVERLLQVEVLTIENEQEVFTAGSAKTEAWIICRRAGRGPWSAGWVYAHIHVRPKGRTASRFRTCVIDPGLGWIRQLQKCRRVSKLAEMAAWLPEFAERIRKIQARVWDLLPVVRDHYLSPQVRRVVFPKGGAACAGSRDDLRGLARGDGQDAALAGCR
jgi:predicted nucleic-acid-binding protein